MKVDSPAQTSQLPSAHAGPSGGLRRAAEQFEAMFVGQMLRSVRESASEETDDDDSDTNSPFLEMAEDQLAQAMAARGGLGIATIVMTDLGKAK
jgi:flagellar protein FlgJ